MLSIIVPAYNAEKTLTDCLEAIRKSHFKNYELIVVDDGSLDGTLGIAERYADKVIRLEKTRGISAARNKGAEAAEGEILVNIDADIVVFADTLANIEDYFARHPDVDAITGLLSAQHPNNNFFSQYKNLYMHYMFRRLPEQVTFLYASICALQKNAYAPYDTNFLWGVDTELGQRMTAAGRIIHCLKHLEVIHLKKYSFRSFLANDFRIAFWWARVFLKYQGWRQIIKGRGNFSHASGAQIGSILVLNLSGVAFANAAFYPPVFIFVIALLGAWIILNFPFFSYLCRARGRVFCLKSIALTFFDQMIMTVGMVVGAVLYFRENIFRNIVVESHADEKPLA